MDDKSIAYTGGVNMNNLKILCLSLCLFIFPPCLTHAQDTKQNTPKPIATYAGGELYKAGKIKILNLKGNFYKMGKQYGGLVPKELQNFYAAIMTEIQPRESYQDILKLATAIYNGYPVKYQNFLRGIKDSSGLSMEKIMIINAFEHYMFSAKSNINLPSECSAIAAWGQYTNWAPLIFGRNYDFISNVDQFKKYLVVTLFNPKGSGVSTAMITFVGTLNATTNMNANGIFLELNNGSPSGGSLHFINRISTPVLLLSMALDSNTFDQLDEEMHTIKSNASFIINAADSKQAVSYEWPPFFNVDKRSGENDGLLVSTNHFVDDAWGIPKPHDTFLTITRRNNLLNLGDKNKGSIGISQMESILDTSIENGGATSYFAGPNRPYTTYQIIAIPKKLTIWIKEPDYQDWTKINLAKYFK